MAHTKKSPALIRISKRLAKEQHNHNSTREQLLTLNRKYLDLETRCSEKEQQLLVAENRVTLLAEKARLLGELRVLNRRTICELIAEIDQLEMHLSEAKLDAERALVDCRKRVSKRVTLRITNSSD